MILRCLHGVLDNFYHVIVAMVAICSHLDNLRTLLGAPQATTRTLNILMTISSVTRGSHGTQYMYNKPM